MEMKLKWEQEDDKGTTYICDTEQMHLGCQKKWTRKISIDGVNFNLFGMRWNHM